MNHAGEPSLAQAILADPETGLRQNLPAEIGQSGPCGEDSWPAALPAWYCWPASTG